MDQVIEQDGKWWVFLKWQDADELGPRRPVYCGPFDSREEAVQLTGVSDSCLTP